jgi:gliding motility-associated-like protein
MRFILILYLLIYIQLHNIELNAQCDNSVVPPTTINNIYITHNYSGSVNFYTPAFSSNCVNGTVTTPPNSVWLGRNGTFTYTLNFNTNVNNLIIVITATGHVNNENFVFTTNSGNPSITSSNNCLTMIVGNEIISGSQTNPGATGSSGGGGGGIFTITNNTPFNTLTITGNGGQAGSLLALCSSSVVDVDKSTYFSQTIYRCPNSPFIIGNKSYTTPGKYFDTLINYENYDSIVTTILKDLPTHNQSISRTICEGDFTRVGQKKYTTAGNYIDTLRNEYGCDSIVKLNLTIKPKSTHFIEHTICEGTSIQIGQKIYSQSGNYIDTLSNYRGCDSILSIEIKNQLKTYEQLQLTLCDGDSLYYNSKKYKNSGSFNDTFVNYYGCDSILNINIENLNKKLYTHHFYKCFDDTIIHENKIYTEIGETFEFLKSYQNCDSIVSVKIQLLPNLTKCKDATFFIPTAFSPNNDGHNDVFKIEGEHIKEIEIIIFNRWGEILLHSKDKTAQWDGYYQQKICQDGLYFYQAKIKANNLKVYYQNGTFQLLN